jgi:hypothetical protein
MKVRHSLLISWLLVPILFAQAPVNDPLASMEMKLQHIAANASAAPPDQTATELTDAEVNAYFASGRLDLPLGVKSVILSSQPGVISGTARVDFDQVRQGRSNYNPLLSVFNGEHNVGVVAQAYGAGGKGFVHVQRVTLDDVEIPNFALQMFVEKYVTNRYPNVGLDSQFRLPYRIDTASVGSHEVSITQK